MSGWSSLHAFHWSLLVEITFAHLHLFFKMNDVVLQRHGARFFLKKVFNHVIVRRAIRFPFRCCWGVEWIWATIKVPLRFAVRHDTYSDERRSGSIHRLHRTLMLFATTKKMWHSFYVAEAKITLPEKEKNSCWLASSKNRTEERRKRKRACASIVCSL